MKDWIGKFIHNCIAHPLTCFLPKDMGDRFHDWTIEKFWPPEQTVYWDSKTDTISVKGIVKGRGE